MKFNYFDPIALFLILSMPAIILYAFPITTAIIYAPLAFVGLCIAHHLDYLRSKRYERQ